FSSRRRHTRSKRDWSSDVCSSDLGSLFGLQESNPVGTDVAYQGPSSNYGTSSDPMIGGKIGGVNVFGGGLALYAPGRKLVGAVEIGRASCRERVEIWGVGGAVKKK